MGIDSVHLQNFQSHADNLLEFTPGINVITGSSDVGKSSIMRAIKWVVTNRPSGNAFTSHFASKPKTSVSLVIDGRKVERTRFKSINKYRLDKVDYKAIRTDIPQEVQDFVNLSEEVNLQSQHDSYFLLQDSSGEVAKKLNKVANLAIIDYSLKSVNVGITGTNRDVNTGKSTISDLESELEKYDNLDWVEQLCSDLNDFLSEISDLEQEQEELEALLDRIEVIENNIWECNIYVSLEKTVDNLVSQTGEIQELIDYNDKLLQLVESIESSKNGIEDIEIILSFEPIIKTILDFITDYQFLFQEVDDLENLVNAIEECESGIQVADKLIDRTVAKMIKLVKETGICPICGNTSTTHVADHIMRWLNV
jgi:DNA repair protein SbcC/Rad50